ncbi:MAG TPA: GspH/FimT family pseudopilin [Woeseiaceae bacterium]|jgi:type IV fimbrial biogenesis protein FimT|nr:GspH/FimT family pseudopilin [Woeseiaceae bacterium]
MRTKTQAGFTLYELLITVLIVGVVLTFAIPNMQGFAANSRMTSTANDMHAAFHLARSESSRAKTNISICPSDDGVSCGGTWEDGYIVFVDEDGDLVVDGGNETVLRQHGTIADGVSMRIAGAASYFSYSSTGLGRPNVGGNTAVSQVVMCDERGNIVGPGGNSAARLFIVTPLGRATIIRDIDMIDDALTAMGATCP